MFGRDASLHRATIQFLFGLVFLRTLSSYCTFSNCRLSVSKQIWPVASVFVEPNPICHDLSCDLPKKWATSVILDSEHHTVSHFASATSLTCTARRLLLQTLQTKKNSDRKCSCKKIVNKKCTLMRKTVKRSEKHTFSSEKYTFFTLLKFEK